MKRLLLSVLFLVGFVSLVYAKGIDTEARIDTTGFPFDSVLRTDSNELADTPETDTIVWTPASGKKIVLMGMKFNSDTATTLLVESGSSVVIPITECTASGQVVYQTSTPIWTGADDATLTYTVGTAGRHSILLQGYEID